MHAHEPFADVDEADGAREGGFDEGGEEVEVCVGVCGVEGEGEVARGEADEAQVGGHARFHLA